MPNHVITRLKIQDLGGAILADVQASFLNADRKIDFNVISEMPTCLADFSPDISILNRATLALGKMPDPSLIKEDNLIERLKISNCIRDASTPALVDDIDGIIRAISNYKQCGYMYWYDWSVDQWGTKWNAYGQPDGGFAAEATEFEFETAWSHPVKLISLVSTRNPTVTLRIEYADEDIGSNCGSYTIKNGEVSEVRIAPKIKDQTSGEKKEFAALAFGMHYPSEDPASHGYDENWNYSDEIYDAANA